MSAFTLRTLTFFFCLPICPLMVAVCHGQRDVQISSILFNEGDAIIQGFELTNYGTNVVDMSNWQLCSHDGDQQRVYSSGIGTSIDPGETMLLFSWDFAMAEPFGPEAYSLSIFDRDAGGFGGTANMIDHVQWSVDGEHDDSASIRSQQAVDAGLWTSATDWISTTLDTSTIRLTDSTGGIPHGSDDYETAIIFPPLPCDTTGDGDCDLEDIERLFEFAPTSDDVDIWLLQASSFNNDGLTFRLGDIDLDGDVDSTDLGKLLNNFGPDFGMGAQTGPLPFYSKGDLTFDGYIGSSDLGRLLNNFGFTSAATVAVPEPDLPWPLLMVGCLSLLPGSRRITQRVQAK